MFIVATLHIATNTYRMIGAYVYRVNTPGGVVAYLNDLATWHHVFKDALFCTQELFGDLIAMYRCWVIWNRNWMVIALPFLLFLVSAGSAYAVIVLFTTTPSDANVFTKRLQTWILVFYATEVVQSALITGFIAYRIWNTDRAVAPFRASNKSNLMPILRILVESVALQLLVEILVLALYAAQMNAQYILLETICSLVGITYTALIIRVALQLELSSSHERRLSGSDVRGSPCAVVLPPMSENNLAPNTVTSHRNQRLTPNHLITPKLSPITSNIDTPLLVSRLQGHQGLIEKEKKEVEADGESQNQWDREDVWKDESSALENEVRSRNWRLEDPESQPAEPLSGCHPSRWKRRKSY
ncbi:unnamed protein product [Somion occarium]|uniref:Uncharacterized protein n=1 Tax=Somion occarium TaxID=3059160 RepID=A0ABP1DWY8_9APHY